MISIAVIGGIFGLLAVAGKMVASDMQLQHRQRFDQWQAVATELGLQYVGGDNPLKQGMLMGSIRGFGVRVEADRKENGSILIFSVQLPRAEGPPFSLTRRSNALSGRLRDEPLLNHLANQLKSGEQGFDQTVAVTAPDERAVADYLTARRQDAVLELFNATRDPKTQVTNSDIRTTVATDDPAIIAPMVSLLVDTATALGAPQDREPPQDQPRQD